MLTGRRALRQAVFALLLFVARPANPDVMSGPTSPGAKAMSEALDLLKQGKLKEADARFAELLRQDPTYITAQLGRAQIALDTGATADAERMVRAALAAKPNAPEAHNMLGILLLAQKHQAEARREFEEALRLHPTYITPRAYIATMARAGREWKVAEAQFRELIRLAPREPFGHLGLAELLIVRQGVDAGLLVLEQWKQVDPRSSEPYTFKAEVCAAQGRAAEATKEIEQAVKMSPPSPMPSASRVTS